MSECSFGGLTDGLFLINTSDPYLHIMYRYLIIRKNNEQNLPRILDGPNGSMEHFTVPKSNLLSIFSLRRMQQRPHLSFVLRCIDISCSAKTSSKASWKIQLVHHGTKMMLDPMVFATIHEPHKTRSLAFRSAQQASNSFVNTPKRYTCVKG